jgi:opacity protein-like surface antigen
MRRTFFVVLVTALSGLLFVSAASAKIGFMGIGGRVGYVKPEDPIEGTFGVGVVADLGTIVPALHLEGSVDYWSKSYDASYMTWDASWTYSDFIVAATAKYMIPTQGTVAPYVGGGLALHRFGWEYSYDYIWEDPYYDEECSDSCSDSETDIGFHAVGGFQAKLSPTLRGGIEGRYAIADPDHFGIFGTLTYDLMP